MSNMHLPLTAGTVALLCIMLLCLAAPVAAGDKYLYGAPDLAASVAGPNEFAPGKEISIPVRIENRGLNTVKIAQSSIISRDDLPNTAKMVSARLTAGESPVTVKSDRQMIGDIAGGAGQTVTFLARTGDNAAAGDVSMALVLEYTYLASAEQYGADTIVYRYATTTETIPVTIRIKPAAAIAIDAVSTESINVGTEGYLSLTVRNSGTETAKAAVVVIERNGNSPLIPTDSSVFAGDLPPGASVPCTFKVSVATTAEPQTYPIDLRLRYENSDGVVVLSDAVTIGITAGGKSTFAVSPVSESIAPGESRIIEVAYTNTGAATAYRAQARISAVDPFTSSDDTAYLGDLAPGESANARFEVAIDTGATEKQYGIDTEVRYRDALDNSQISDTVKIEVDIADNGGGASALLSPLAAGFLLIGCVSSAYYFLRIRKRA